MSSFSERLAPRPGLLTGIPFATVVVRNDSTGVWVAPVDAQTREHPIGPCLGARRPDGSTPPISASVLVVLTDSGPWVVAEEHPEAP